MPMKSNPIRGYVWFSFISTTTITTTNTSLWNNVEAEVTKYNKMNEIELETRWSYLRAIPELTPIHTSKSSFSKLVIIVKIIGSQLQFLQRKNPPLFGLLFSFIFPVQIQFEVWTISCKHITGLDLYINFNTYQLNSSWKLIKETRNPH